MTIPNTNFKLGVEDIDIIEHALQKELKRLAEHRLSYTQSTIKLEHEIDSVREIDDEVKRINELLGRLHNQKEWYRPKQQDYIGG
jgi:hypothetical protein